MAAKSTGSKKLTGLEQRALAEQLAQARVDPAVEARVHERKFLDGLAGAADDLEWLATNQAWVPLGHETCAAWWAAIVKPVADGLGFEPTRELGMRFVELIRAEEAALPPAQRRSNKELATFVGVSEWAVRGRKEIRQRRTAPYVDHDGPVLDGTYTEEPPVAEPDPSHLADAVSQMLTDTAASIGTGIPAPAAPDLGIDCSTAPDAKHCAVCGDPISWPNWTAGRLRCPACDPSSKHKAIVVDDKHTRECDECTRLAQQTAAGGSDAPPADGVKLSRVAPAGSGDRPRVAGPGNPEERIEEGRCESCGRMIDADQVAQGYARCDDCDSDGDHVRPELDEGGRGPCARCIDLAAERAALATAQREDAARRLRDFESGALEADGAAKHFMDVECPASDDPDTVLLWAADIHDTTCLDCLRIVVASTDSPAAETIPNPPVEPSPTAEPQQPGQDSPPVLGSEGFPGRAETDHHEPGAGLGSGEAPGGDQQRAPVEPVELEDGEVKPPVSPSSSDATDIDRLLRLLGEVVMDLAVLDIWAIGPQLLDDEMTLLVQHGDDIQDWIARLEKARTP